MPYEEVMQVQVARVWWPQTFSPANVSVLSSYVNNGRVLLGKCAIFIIYIKYKNGLLNILVRNALALEKISTSCCHIVPTFRIKRLILVYWSQNLWNVLPAVPYPVFKWNPQRPHFTVMNRNGSNYKINVMTWLQFTYYSPVHSNI